MHITRPPAMNLRGGIRPLRVAGVPMPRRRGNSFKYFTFAQISVKCAVY